MKSKPTLLLLPGLMCDATVWRGQVTAFRRQFEVIVADYGDASTIEQMAFAALAAAPERFTLAGHSMGGRVALEIYFEEPERVSAMALLDTGVHPVRAGEAASRHELLDLGRTQGIDALVEAWLPSMMHPDHRAVPELYGPLYDMCVRSGLATYEAHTAALLSRPDPRPTLHAIDCPTLIATGSHDQWSSVEQHREIARHIPGSSFRIFRAAGHMAPFESPGIVNDILSEWLETNAANQKEPA